MKEQKTDEKMNPGDYYKSLDYPNRILFKREAKKHLRWSAKTFDNRMSKGGFRPGELVILGQIIETKSFLNPSQDV